MGITKESEQDIQRKQKDDRKDGKEATKRWIQTQDPRIVSKELKKAKRAKNTLWAERCLDSLNEFKRSIDEALTPPPADILNDNEDASLPLDPNHPLLRGLDRETMLKTMPHLSTESIDDMLRWMGDEKKVETFLQRRTDIHRDFLSTGDGRDELKATWKEVVRIVALRKAIVKRQDGEAVGSILADFLRV